MNAPDGKGRDYCPTCHAVGIGHCATASGRDHFARKVWRQAYRDAGLVNPPKRKRREAPEAPELGAASRRFANALARRAAEEGDDVALEQLVEVRTAVDVAIEHAARGMHGRGYSWTEIAERVGMTRQGALKAYGTRKGGR